MQKLLNLWYKKKSWIFILLPLSWLFQLIVVIRRSLYQCKLVATYQPPVPVIIVGNIAIGGTGKTPFVIALAKFLRQQGYKPGIVSRGYKGEVGTAPVSVTVNSSVQQVGDEALLIAKQTQCPVVVHPKRVKASKALLARYDCDVIISDDGLQHYALQRDIEIVLVDAERRFGNGLCLPAGPLREPLSRLKKVDFVVCNGQAETGEYAITITTDVLHQVKQACQTSRVDSLLGQTIHAVAGIGNPQRFFNTLQELGLTIKEHAFPDHHTYQQQDLQFAQPGVIVMTEKDAVKCQSLVDNNAWYLPIAAELPNDLTTSLIKLLNHTQVQSPVTHRLLEK